MKWLTYFDKTALVYESRRIHYRQLFAAIAAIGEALRREYGPEARIALVGANSPEWVLALYAAWHAGFTVVPIDYMSTAEEIAFILHDSTPAAIFADASSDSKVRAACRAVGGIAPELHPLESLERLFHDAPAIHPAPGMSPDSAIALIIYTSGTTGNPKGVMLTFRNLRANTEACSVQTRVFIPEDRVLVALPLHHAYPLMGSLVMPMSIGATAVFASSLTGSAILDALRENQCTFIIGVPRLLEIFRNAMLKKIRERRLGGLMLAISAACGSLRLSRIIFRRVQEAFGGHIRYIASGGAPADPQVTRDFYAMGFHLLEGYGMTETAPMISFTPPSRHKPGSPGKPIPCNEIRIQDGEVLVRGANVMKGYYNRPEETAQIIDPDGWLHTGDLGYVDKDGFLFLTGRSKELIILGNGKNINPVELEAKLMGYADGMFSECAVSDDGQHLVGIVVPEKETLAARGVLNIRQTLMDKVVEPYNEAVPSYKRIARLELSEEPLPRTRLGKPRRHIIRKMLQEGAMASRTDEAHGEGRAEACASPMEEQICQCLAEVAGRTVCPEEHFELDLNLDSLGKLALYSALCKEMHREFDVFLLAKCPTARMLAAALANGGSGAAPVNNAPAMRRPELSKPAWNHGMLRGMMRTAMRMLSRVAVEGTQHIPEGPCIFAPNHQSLLDALYLSGALDARRYRETYFYAIGKFFDGPLKRRFARRHNLITMEINGDLAQSLAQLEEALRQGKSIVIFPEGTRTMDGTLGDFRPAFAQLALATGATVVPVAIDGAYEVLPRWARWPRFGKDVRIAFLPPCTPQPDAPAEAFAAAVQRAISHALSR